MKHIYIRTLITVTLALVVAVPVAAETDRTQDINSSRQSTQEKRDEKKQLVAAKLAENKMKVCEKRLDIIKRIMSKAHERGQKQLDVFTKIADRTNTFYEEKNYSVANYEDLVAAVDEKRQSAELSIAMSSETIDQFVCDSEDPLAIKDLFKAQIKDQNTALKEYRTAIKDLIVAIKSSKSQSDRTTTETTEQEASE